MMISQRTVAAIVLLGFVTTTQGATPIDAKARNALIEPDKGGNELSVTNAAGGSLEGTAADDRVMGSPGPDRIDGGGGNDGIRSRSGDDELLGGDGNDYVKGGPGNDRLSGGEGDDRYVFAPGDGNDSVEDRAGKNLLALTGLSGRPPQIAKRATKYMVSHGSGFAKAAVTINCDSARESVPPTSNSRARVVWFWWS